MNPLIHMLRRWRIEALSLVLLTAAAMCTVGLQHPGVVRTRECRTQIVDSTLLEEDDSSAIAQVLRVYVQGDYLVILGYDDPTVCVRSLSTGQILFRYALPLDVCDSVFPAPRDSIMKYEGRLLRNGWQVYGASRRRMSPATQTLRLHHKVLGVSFPRGDLMLIHAHIAGMLYCPQQWKSGYATGWTQAMLSLRIPSCELLGVRLLPTWSQEYLLTSGMISNDGASILYGAVDFRWRDRRVPFRQNTMASFSVHDGTMRFFAERDSGNMTTMAAFPVAAWTGHDSYLYANGNDRAVWSSPGETCYALPEDSTAGVSAYREELIRGISIGRDLVGVYRTGYGPARLQHVVHIFDRKNAAYLGTASLRTPRGDILHAWLVSDSVIAALVKSEDVFLVRFRVDMNTLAPSLGARR
jgi:hypothetical protein